MTLRTKLVALMLLLGITLAAISSYQAVVIWTSRHHHLQMQGLNRVSDLLLSATGAWAVERGTTNVVINSPAAATDAQRATIATKREQGDEAFAEAIALLGELELSTDLSPVLERVRAPQARVVELRRQIDRLIADPEAAPDPDLVRDWFAAASDLIMQGQELRLSAEREIGGTADPMVLDSLRVKHALWEISEFAGRERGFMSGVIAAGQPLTSAQLQTVAAFRSQVESAWQAVQGAQRRLGPQVQAAIAAADMTYFHTFEQLRRAVYRASATGQPYPATAAEWFDQATIGIAGVLDAQQQVTEHTAELIAANVATALSASMFNINLLVAAFAIIGVAGLVLAW